MRLEVEVPTALRMNVPEVDGRTEAPRSRYGTLDVADSAGHVQEEVRVEGEGPTTVQIMMNRRLEEWKPRAVGLGL